MNANLDARQLSALLDRLDTTGCIVTSAHAGQVDGCFVSFVGPCSIHPKRLLVLTSHENLTHELVEHSGVLAVHPGAAGICVAVFALVFFLSRYVSLGSLSAAVAFPIAVVLIYHEISAVKIGFAIVLCVMVFYTHRENIGRLWRGEENRMGRRLGRTGTQS